MARSSMHPPCVYAHVHPADPCSFTVRHAPLLPQRLLDGDRLGPLPIAPATHHTYSVQVGGYPTLRHAVSWLPLDRLLIAS